MQTRQLRLDHPDFQPPVITLNDWHLLVLNSSGGKDSQTMINLVARLAREQGYSRANIYVVHADLGRAEWPGTRELAQNQAEAHGFQFIAVQRPQGDLLTHIEQRGRWPAPRTRYCTSDHKRGQVDKVITRLHRELGPHRQLFRVLNCLGMRAEESPARAQRPPLAPNQRLTTRRREVWEWLPIHHWTEAQVWEDIRASGVPHHRAYDLGMPRLSCVFCIYAPRPALVLAGRHNPELLEEYVALERRMGHTFRPDLSLASIQQAVPEGEVSTKMNGRWNM